MAYNNTDNKNSLSMNITNIKNFDFCLIFLSGLSLWIIILCHLYHYWKKFGSIIIFKIEDNDFNYNLIIELLSLIIPLYFFTSGWRYALTTKKDLKKYFIFIIPILIFITLEYKYFGIIDIDDDIPTNIQLLSHMRIGFISIPSYHFFIAIIFYYNEKIFKFSKIPVIPYNNLGINEDNLNLLDKEICINNNEESNEPYCKFIHFSYFYALISIIIYFTIIIGLYYFISNNILIFLLSLYYWITMITLLCCTYILKISPQYIFMVIYIITLCTSIILQFKFNYFKEISGLSIFITFFHYILFYIGGYCFACLRLGNRLSKIYINIGFIILYFYYIYYKPIGIKYFSSLIFPYYFIPTRTTWIIEIIWINIFILTIFLSKLDNIINYKQWMEIIWFHLPYLIIIFIFPLSPLFEYIGNYAINVI
ncbi:hypothetical protein ACR3K2_38760 [Cryptosporidium serpentis]